MGRKKQEPITQEQIEELRKLVEEHGQIYSNRLPRAIDDYPPKKQKPSTTTVFRKVWARYRTRVLHAPTLVCIENLPTQEIVVLPILLTSDVCKALSWDMRQVKVWRTSVDTLGVNPGVSIRVYERSNDETKNG